MNQFVWIATILGLLTNIIVSSEGVRLRRSPAMVSMTAIAGRGSMVVHQDENGERIVLDGRNPKDVHRKLKSDKNDSEENDDSSFVLFDTKGFKGANSFFPMMFPDSSEGKSRQVEGVASGFADDSVAIANSFSTGKSGVANSHATSFGENADRFFRSKRKTTDDVVEERTGKQAFENTFFPVNFQQYGSPLRRYSEETSDYPKDFGNFMAISNSFSTGRSGIANSHATSFGNSGARIKRSTQYPAQEERDAGSANVFFPITFNGNGALGRSTQEAEGGLPGIVAISNSFATGKSGVANSRSIAVGNPNLYRTKRSTATLHMTYGPSSDDSYNPNNRNAKQFESQGNTYFPISFHGYGASATARQGAGGGYGGSTAIANSFATGRSGVANSQATAFGDPSAAAKFLRNSGA